MLSRWRVSHRLVVEDSPDPADLALLEEHVAAAAVAAAGVGLSRNSGSFLRDDDGRVLAGISGIVWGVLRGAGDAGR